MDNENETVLIDSLLTNEEFNLTETTAIQQQQSDIDLELEKIEKLQLSQIETYLKTEPKKSSPSISE